MASSVKYSDWIWSEEHKRHYCGVYDTRTNKLLQYQWEGGQTQGVTASSSATPQQASSQAPQTHSQYSGYGAASLAARPRTVPSQSEEPDQEDEEDAEEDDDTPAAAVGRNSASPDQSYTTDPYRPSSTAAPSHTYGTASSSYRPQAGYTVKQYGQSSYAQPSHTASYNASYNASYGTSRPQLGNAYHSSSTQNRHDSHFQPAAESPEEKEAELQSKVDEITSSKKQRNLKTGNDGRDYERLDSNYRRIQKNTQNEFFVRGRVFMMLWSEPAGTTKPGGTRGSTHFSTTYLGGQAYTEIRRFVVMRNKGVFSQCIPIQTYRRQGVTKPGVNGVDHAVIYTTPYPLPLVPGEAQILTKTAIRVEAVSGQGLEAQSRVNFGKPYTVEHNVKLLEIGMVSNNCIYLLDTYFREAMGFS